MTSIHKLNNVYCLGCKTRHETVTLDEVVTLTVRGSPRYQGKGVCENGKTWCKMIKLQDIPEEFKKQTPVEDEVKSIEVFEKGAEINSTSDVPIEVTPTVSIVEPVVAELVVEEPIHVPQQAVETYEAPQTYYDGTNGLEEGEEEEEEIMVRGTESVVAEPLLSNDRSIIDVKESDARDFLEARNLRHTKTVDTLRPSRNYRRNDDYKRNRPPIRRPDVDPVSPHRPLRPDISVKAEEKPLDSVSRATKVGSFMGASMYEAVGEDYVKYVRQNWERTKVSENNYAAFEKAYLDAGKSSPTTPTVSEDEQMSGRTVAGIAGLGILAAWVASQINK